MGKPPPPTVRLMRHAGPPEVPEWQALGHGTVFQGSRSEEAEDCGDRYKAEIEAGLRGIEVTDIKCFYILMPGEGVDSG